MEKHENTRKLKSLAADMGASAVGICRVESLADSFHPEIRETAGQLPYAISIGIALQRVVLGSLTNRPNEIYKAHYKAVNAHLDRISHDLANAISRMNFNAMPIPASMVIKRYPMIGHVNHREVAHKAGLGWRGKNNLLVNPVFGSRLRLTTVLTDIPLTPDRVIPDSCDSCGVCRDICPVEAIRDSAEEFDLDRCRDQVIRFSRDNNFGQLICGLCLNSCPEIRKDTVYYAQSGDD